MTERQPNSASNETPRNVGEGDDVSRGDLDKLQRTSRQQSQEMLTDPMSAVEPLDQESLNDSMRFMVSRFPHWFSRVCVRSLEPDKFPEDQVILDELARNRGTGSQATGEEEKR